MFKNPEESKDGFQGVGISENVSEQKFPGSAYLKRSRKTVYLFNSEENSTIMQIMKKHNA